MYDFSGKVALITGASRGIGSALAHALASEGANLCLVARDAEAVRNTAYDARRAFGVDAMGRACDIRDAKRVSDLVNEAMTRFGRIDLAINNAAVLGQMAPVHEYSPDQWPSTFATNLHGAFHVARYVIPKMTENGGGRIVFVGSSVGRSMRAGWGAYAVSKWALEGMMQLIALESEQTKVTSCSINPGGAATMMRRAAYPQEDQGQLPSPDQVAQAFLKILRLPDKALNGRAFNARDPL